MNVYTSFMLFIMAVTVQVWLSDASQTQFPDSKFQADEGRQIFGPVMNLNLSQQGRLKCLTVKGKFTGYLFKN